MNVSLRQMKNDDIKQVTELEAACFSDPWSERLLADMLESPYDEAWVLVAEGEEIIAYANFRFLAGEGELMRIAVLPPFRGNGYSRKLMERLEESAIKQDADALTLEVREGNTPALNLYKSCGFSQEAVRKNYYRNPTENAILMRRQNLLVITT